MNFKKIANTVLAAMMAMFVMTTTAFAAPESTCSICGDAVPLDISDSDTKTYMEAYGVPEIENLTSNGSVYLGSNIYTAAFNGELICKDCLEVKIAEYKASQNTTTSKDVPVNANVQSNYILLIPQSVVLTNSAGGAGTYSSNFNVSVAGDVGESQVVTVTTTAPTMKRTGSKDVVATVTTPKITWNRDEILAATASTYTVKADLTSGAWAGVMTFNCTLK